MGDKVVGGGEIPAGRGSLDDDGDDLGQPELGRAIDAVASGAGPILVLIESGDGTAGDVADRIPSALGPVARAAGSEVTRVKVGCLAEELGLDSMDAGVIVVDNAQWADPTSLGRLQRRLKTTAGSLLVVVAHRPVEGTEAWAIDQLRSAVGRHAEVVEMSLGAPADAAATTLPPDPAARDIVLAASLVSYPLGVTILARLVEMTEEDTLARAESLVEGGLLRQSRGGFVSARPGLLAAAGEARVGYVADRLADVLEADSSDPAVIGVLRLAAGKPSEAFPHLAAAASSASERGAGGEAFYLADSALGAAGEARVGTPSELGDLHLICGRYLRAAGRSESAAHHLDRAVSLLSGEPRVDALGFAAAVADDRQHPQEAERILAMAELEAARLGAAAKLASLGTFRARALNRIGFAAEADAMLDKSISALGDTSPRQRHFAEVNRAWISFDRGQVARAEGEFTRLRDASAAADHAALAETEAWRARALFGCGRVQEALEAVTVAREAAERGEVEAPLFLSDLALAEGNLLFGRHQKALEATERVLDLVERQLPAWENVARCQRALALAGLARLDEATSEVAAALAATPAGANGWRWRSRGRAIQMEIDARAGRGWDRQAAVDLADMFLQSELYGWAAELLCVIAEQGKDKAVAREAAALAYQIGNPMLAARAAGAGKLWNDPVASPVIRAVRAMKPQVPPQWQDHWQSLPAITEALAAPEPAIGDAAVEAAAVLDRALQRAGLAGAQTVLSPAQRRKQGLVGRRQPWRPLRVAIASFGVIVLAAATSVGVAQLRAEAPGVTVVREVVTSVVTGEEAPLTLEETLIPVPDGIDFFFGVVPDRGGAGRNGYIDTSGPREVDGYYWSFPTADPIAATPVAYGNNLMVGSTDGTFYALDQTTGRVAWTMSSEDGISAAPALASAELGEGQTAPLVIVVADDGVVRARNAVIEVDDVLWSSPQLGNRIRSSPLAIGERVFVATTDGVVFALSLFTGEELWRYPDPGEGGVESLGPISAGLTHADGILYVATQDGTLHLLDEEGQLVCETTLSGGVVVNPVVADGVVYIGTRANLIHMLPAGVCDVPPDQLRQLVTETAVTVAPAIVDGVMYQPSGAFLYQIDVATGQHMWAPSTVFADGDIASPPVVDNETVYFGTEVGSVYAVDAASGELLWQWRTGNYVRAAPVVVEGVVFIASGDGNVYAIGPAD